MEYEKITIGDKKYRLMPEEDYQPSTEELKKPRTGYEQKSLEKDDTYYVQGVATRFCNDENDRTNFLNGYFETDEQLSWDNARADSILRRMRQWQALNDDAVDYNRGLEKWHIYYDKTSGVLKTDYNQECIITFCVYFSSKEKAEEALEVFRDDLIWLHTQYRRRLDEPKRN